MPVLPLVGSITTPPLARRSSFSACSIIDRQIRSLTEPPGFADSSLPNSRARGLSRPSRRISTSGVSPIRSSARLKTSGCEGSGGSVGSDDVDIALAPRTAQPGLFGSRTDIGDRQPIEAGLDAIGQITKNRFGHAPGVAAEPRPARAAFALTEHDRPLERADHVTEPDFVRASGQAIATLWPALGAHDARALEILKDLFEKTRWDALALGDILHLSRPALVEEGDIEQRAHCIAPLVRELHEASYAFTHRICQEHERPIDRPVEGGPEPRTVMKKLQKNATVRGAQRPAPQFPRSSWPRRRAWV